MLIPPFLAPTLFGMPFRVNCVAYLVQGAALLLFGRALLPPFEVVVSYVIAEAAAYALERNQRITFFIVDLRGRKERGAKVKLLLARVANSRVQRDIELRNVRAPAPACGGVVPPAHPPLRPRRPSNTSPSSATRSATRRTASSATRNCCRTRSCRPTSETS